MSASSSLPERSSFPEGGFLPPGLPAEKVCFTPLQGIPVGSGKGRPLLPAREQPECRCLSASFPSGSRETLSHKVSIPTGRYSWRKQEGRIASSRRVPDRLPLCPHFLLGTEKSPWRRSETRSGRRPGYPRSRSDGQVAFMTAVVHASGIAGRVLHAGLLRSGRSFRHAGPSAGPRNRPTSPAPVVISWPHCCRNSTAFQSAQDSLNLVRDGADPCNAASVHRNWRRFFPGRIRLIPSCRVNRLLRKVS